MPEGMIVDDPFPAGLVEDWSKLFLSEDSRQPVEDTYAAVFEGGLTFPLQRKIELAYMMQIARSYSPQVVCEIGADRAGGLYHWCKSLPTVKKVIACEIRGTPYKYEFEKAFPHIQFLWIEESSFGDGVLDRVATFANDIDCLFIDGDKCFFDLDFINFLQLMSDHSVAFMHDITDCNPGDAFKRVRKDFAYKLSGSYEVIDKLEGYEARAKSLRGEKMNNAHEAWLAHWGGSSCGVGVLQIDKNKGK
jgi:hypothetical protein